MNLLFIANPNFDYEESKEEDFKTIDLEDFNTRNLEEDQEIDVFSQNENNKSYSTAEIALTALGSIIGLFVIYKVGSYILSLIFKPKAPRKLKTPFNDEDNKEKDKKNNEEVKKSAEIAKDKTVFIEIYVISENDFVKEFSDNGIDNGIKTSYAECLIKELINIKKELETKYNNIEFKTMIWTFSPKAQTTIENLLSQYENKIESSVYKDQFKKLSTNQEKFSSIIKTAKEILDQLKNKKDRLYLGSPFLCMSPGTRFDDQDIKSLVQFWNETEEKSNETHNYIIKQLLGLNSQAEISNFCKIFCNRIKERIVTKLTEAGMVKKNLEEEKNNCNKSNSKKARHFFNYILRG